MANKQFKVPINLVNLASDPGTASEGDIYYNTTSDTVKVYANGAWASIGSGGGGSTSLDGVTDVTITSVADNEVLAYDSASSLWINQTASEAGLATTSGNLSQFAATTSSQLLGVISDETGTGALVFGTSPTFTTSVIGGATFSAFATTDNLTIGESNGYTVDGTFTNNVLSGGNVSDSVSLLTLTDNYSVRNLVSTVNEVNHTINIGTGSITNNANYATKNINIGTGTILYDGNTYITIGATGATIDINATTLSIGGAATTLAIGSTSTATKTLNLFNGATVSGATKTINIGTQGVSGSTTNINIGSSVSGSGGTVTISESLSLSESVSIAASKNIAVASHYSGSFGTGRVVMTGTGSNPTTRPDGTSLVAGDVWIAY